MQDLLDGAITASSLILCSVMHQILQFQRLVDPMPVYYLKVIQKIKLHQNLTVLLRPVLWSQKGLICISVISVSPSGALTSRQSPVQFQGEGSSHELAGVLLTECIKYSKNSLKQPLYVLYLDAQSAFDVVQRELLLKNLFTLHNADQILIHIDNRLANRETIVDWDGEMMGPIADEQGLEQGGINSSEFYKIFGKEQLTTAQMSDLGVRLRNLTVSSIGQADNTLLLSNDIYALYYLLHLTQSFCSKYLVNLSAEKTKLQVYKRSKDDPEILHNPIKIDGKIVPFVDETEHVGIIRSTEGNGPAIARHSQQYYIEECLKVIVEIQCTA